MIRIGICDDEEFYRGYVDRECRSYFGETDIEISAFESGRELLKSNQEFEIVFLDIEMPDMDGISLKEAFEREKRTTRIIFFTSHNERKEDAFGKNVMRFLNKPVEKEKFRQALDRVMSDLQEELLPVRDNGETSLLNLKEVKYVEAKGKYTSVISTDKSRFLRKTMKYWEGVLPSPPFCRINKSFFVNFNYYAIHNNEIILEAGKCVKLSRRYKSTIMEVYKSYLRKK